MSKHDAWAVLAIVTYLPIGVAQAAHRVSHLHDIYRKATK